MRLERLNNLPLNTVTPNFVAIFVFFGTASSFIEIISFSEIKAKRQAILFLFGYLEVNSTWIITTGLANQRTPKALFTCVVYTTNYYCWSMYGSLRKNKYAGEGITMRILPTPGILDRVLVFEVLNRSCFKDNIILS